MNALRKVNVDLVFLGVHGMHERAGFTTPNMLEAETNQALIETGGKLIVTADHTKWGVTGVSTIAPLERADVIISDDALDAEARGVLEDRVHQVVLTGPGDTVAALADADTLAVGA